MKTLGRRLLTSLIVLSLAYYAWIALDLITHPFAAGSNAELGTPFLFRWLSFVTGTFTILVALFVMRRVRGNIIGPLLLVWGVGDAGWSLRVDFGSPEITGWASIGFVLYFFVLALPAVIAIFFYFPNGRTYPPSLGRWMLPLFAIVALSGLLTLMGSPPGSQGNSPNPFFVPALEPLNSLFGLAFLLFALGALVSLFFRYRASGTRERLQLKWFLWSLAVLAGLTAVLSTPVSSANVGVRVVSYLWAQGFPAIAIGVAILRHNLWGVDIIIRRTLVYVPLTAILAGVFAASIALSQKLFVALTGTQSDAATVLTTLIVVAAFEPIKSALQKIVDARFREAPDSSKRLKALNDNMRAVLQVIDPAEIARHALDEATAAFDATGGAVYVNANGSARLAYATPTWNGDAKISVPFAQNDALDGRIELGGRKDGAEYGKADRAMLQQTADLMARALAIADRTEG